jgi:hypothetical protein
VFLEIEGPVVGLLKQINFNGEKITHHNIFYNNTKDGYAMIYSNE